MFQSFLLVAMFELVSRFVYMPKLGSTSMNSFYKSVSILNSVKIGIIYGLFVDAFKLGS
nr:Ycf20 [Erythrocladia irregularis]